MNIEELVHDLYWIEDKNCAITTMKVLSEYYDIDIQSQLYESMIAMPGIGKHGLTCGIVNGAIMFISIYGKVLLVDQDNLKEIIHEYVDQFNVLFGSVNCITLRPEGFDMKNPPHLCEQLTTDALKFTCGFIDNRLRIK